jgi:hypothetical protein
MIENPLQQESSLCAQCGATLGEPHAYCGNCDARFCLACGSRHFCTPACRANGCLAGLCVRLVRNGELSRQWGVPPELVQAGERRSSIDADEPDRIGSA